MSFEKCFCFATFTVCVCGVGVCAYILLNPSSEKPGAVWKTEMDGVQCGLVSVATICSLYKIETNMSEVCDRTGYGNEGTNLLNCKRALESYGIACAAVRFGSVGELPESTPVLCVLRDQDGLHSVVMLRKNEEVVMIDGRNIRRMEIHKADHFSANLALITSRP